MTGKATTGLAPNLHEKLAQLDATEPYTSMTIDEAVTAYNAQSIEKIGSAPSSTLNKWAAINGVRKAIFQSSENYDSPAYEAASAARFAMENTAEELDLSDAETQALVAGLVSAGVIPQPAATDLYQRVTTLVSPGQEIGIQKVRRAYIESVRGVL